MKSLDQRLSEVVSPFEDSEIDQAEITQQQFLLYRKDSLIEALGKKTGFQEFDLYLEDVLQELDSDDTILFLTECLNKLKTIYPIEVLVDYIQTENILENNPDIIISFLKFFVYDSFNNKIVPHIPHFEIVDLKDRKSITKKIKDSYFQTQEEIIKDVDIHPLVRYHFKYCPYSDGIKMILIFIFRDLPGVVSAQLVTTAKEN